MENFTFSRGKQLDVGNGRKFPIYEGKTIRWKILHPRGENNLMENFTSTRGKQLDVGFGRKFSIHDGKTT
jgi:hypothetical protein